MSFKFLTKLITTGCALSLVMSAPVFASNLAKVTGDVVNLRSYNSTDGQIVGSAKLDETLTIVSNANNGWFKIKNSQGNEGFISAEYIQIVQTDATCIDEDVNVRTSPSTSASILGKAQKGQVFVTSGKSGDWYIIKFNGSTGYIHKEFMQGSLLGYLPETAVSVSSTEYTAKALSSSSSNIYAVVNADSLNLREEATTDSDAIRTFDEGYNLTVLGYESGWVKVSDDDNNIGYVSSDYITLKNGTKPENVMSKPTPVKGADVIYANTEDVSGENIVEYSKNFLGTPYVWAGTDLRTGVDCSGFVYSVFKDFGISLQRTSRDMFNQGSTVDSDDLEAGDLLFFNSGGESAISHVGIYIGDGQYIHSTNGAGNGVVISDLSSGYATRTYVGAKRVLN